MIGSGAGSAVLTGPQCSKNFMHWTHDLMRWATASPSDHQGRRQDLVHANRRLHVRKDIEQNCADAVTANGGKVLGIVRHPITRRISRPSSAGAIFGADVIAFANAGGDTSQSLTQAAEFGLDSDSGSPRSCSTSGACRRLAWKPRRA